MSTAPQHVVGTLWQRRTWLLRRNPFPDTGIARLGGGERRDNGLLYSDHVNANSFGEVLEKFVVGAAFGGQQFGFLWSLGTDAEGSGATGFGKSVILQRATSLLNSDFGLSAYRAAGLEAEDAEEMPICGLLTSFDTAKIRSLGAALFAAVEYATDFCDTEADPTLAQRLRARLVERVGSDDRQALIERVLDEHRRLRGRTLGPPDRVLIAGLCDPDSRVAADYIDAVKPTVRTRDGSVYLASLFLFAKAAGIRRVLLAVDQLEDLANTSKTTKQKREVETERFRDVLLECQPMADMVSVVLTMHPRAALAIGRAWELSDLPSFAVTAANHHRIVKLTPLRRVDEAVDLFTTYLADARRDDSGRDPSDLHPFTRDAVEALWTRSSKTPRDLLRKAHGLVESAAADNLHAIDAHAINRYLDALGEEDGMTMAPPIAVVRPPDW